MFLEGHIIFIIISILVIIISTSIISVKKPNIETMLTISVVICIVSEIIKTFSVVEIVPIVTPVVEDGAFVYKSINQYIPYIEMIHLPFELCSLDIFFIIIAKFAKSERLRNNMLAFLYFSCMFGGVIAILLSSIAPEYHSIKEFLTSIRAWQFFLYHAFLIVLGLYIRRFYFDKFNYNSMRFVIVFIIILDFFSFHLNSIMMNPVYIDGGTLVGVTNKINYFSSFINPLGIQITTR